MESKLKAALGLSKVKSRGTRGGGCISEGNVFETEKGMIFAKVNKDNEASLMFDGEVAGLTAIDETDTVRVPKPIKVVNLNTAGVALVMEYIEMHGLSKYAETLGEQLARMHLFNASLKT
ncbi:Ketosamine-3-kinase, partial [Stegodyphus mimosarum]